MKSKTTIILLSIIVSIAFILSSCSSWSRTTSGAVIGTGAGAAAGSVIGKTLGNTAAGAIAGAAVGGTVGAIIGRQMDRRAEEIAKELDGVTIQRVEEGIAVSFDSGILFDFDSSTLRAEARENLRKLAQIMSEDDETELMIVGHTDSVGDENYNMRLSLRRAESAANYMISQGLSRNRVSVEGRGENEPIATNETDQGRQENRRVEVAIFASSDHIERLEAEN
ncbi:MAG: OmpA family protein [Balneolaceae bacterium]|nr:OmpA family protein [Balneolaceae bacterium]